MEKQQFIEEITEQFKELFIEAFSDRYFTNFDGTTFEDDFEKTLIILNEKLKKRFKRKIEKMKVIHYE